MARHCSYYDNAFCERECPDHASCSNEACTCQQVPIAQSIPIEGLEKFGDCVWTGEQYMKFGCTDGHLEYGTYHDASCMEVEFEMGVPHCSEEERCAEEHHEDCRWKTHTT